MAQSALGVLLRTLREQRTFSLRELAQLADLDHAYIYRLETGDKESPSDEALSKLVRALKPAKRESEMLRYLAAHPESDSALVTHVLADSTVSFDEFTMVSGMVHRSTAKRDYAKLVDRVRRILESEDDDG